MNETTVDENTIDTNTGEDNLPLQRISSNNSLIATVDHPEIERPDKSSRNNASTNAQSYGKVVIVIFSSSLLFLIFQFIMIISNKIIESNNPLSESKILSEIPSSHPNSFFPSSSFIFNYSSTPTFFPYISPKTPSLFPSIKFTSPIYGQIIDVSTTPSPIIPTNIPSRRPTSYLSPLPISLLRSTFPSESPILNQLTAFPSLRPSSNPTRMAFPSLRPSSNPTRTVFPSLRPSSNPTRDENMRLRDEINELEQSIRTLNYSMGELKKQNSQSALSNKKLDEDNKNFAILNNELYASVVYLNRSMDELSVNKIQLSQQSSLLKALNYEYNDTNNNFRTEINSLNVQVDKLNKTQLLLNRQHYFRCGVVA